MLNETFFDDFQPDFLQYFCAEFCKVNVNSIGKKAAVVSFYSSLRIDSMKSAAFSYYSEKKSNIFSLTYFHSWQTKKRCVVTRKNL